MTQRKHPVFSGFLAVVWLAIAEAFSTTRRNLLITRLLAVMWLAVATATTHAANPSFNALVWTNSGGVITPIKGPTNVVRITSGLADNATNVALVVNSAVPWLDNAAISAAFGTGGTNRGFIGPKGGYYVGKDVFNWWGGAFDGDVLIAHSDRNNGGPEQLSLAFDVINPDLSEAETTLTLGTSSHWSIDYNDAGGQNSNWSIVAGEDSIAIAGQVSNIGSVVVLEPSRPDGATPYIFDTSVVHTSGNLAEIANNGANKFTVGFAGSTSIGTSGEGFQFHFVDPIRTASTWFSSLGATANINVQNTGLSFQLTDTSGDQGVSLEPTVSSGSLPFLLRALQTQSSSNIFEVRNDTVQAFGVTSGNGIFIGNLTNQISRDSVNGNALIITNTGAGTGGLWVGTTNIIGELASKGSGGGDVTGPASSTDNDISVFSGATGKIIKRSTSAATLGDGSSATFTLSSSLSGSTDPNLIFTNAQIIASAPLLSPAGSASAPTFGLSASPNTGYNIQSSSELRLAIAGSSSARFLATQIDIAGSFGRIGLGSATSSGDAAISRDGAANTLQFGDDAATPSSNTAKGPDGSGTDRPGADLELGAGKPTGTGTPGKLKGKVTATGTSTSSSLQAYTTAFALGGTLKVDTTTTGNVGAGEDDLISYTIPAGQLGSNGDYIEFDCFGTFGATVNTAQLKIYYDGTAFFDTTSLLFNGLAWKAHGKIVRTSATAQKITVEFTVGGTLLSAVNGTVTTYATDNATLSGTTVFKITGQDTGGVPADNKVVQEGMILKYYQGL